MVSIKLIIFLKLIFFGAINASLDESCRASDGKNGKCVYLEKCEDLFKMVKYPMVFQITQVDALKLISKNNCGYEQRSPLVCCSTTTFSTSSLLPNKGTKDSWDSGSPGSFPQRPPNTNVQDGAKFNQNLNAKWQVTPKPSIASPSSTTVSSSNGMNKQSFIALPPMKEKPDIKIGSTAAPSVPQKNNQMQNRFLPKDCGRMITFKHFRGNKTEFDDFPWTVLLEYGSPWGVTSLGCGGVLVSNRYVLTAAHCLKNPDSYSQLKSVRFGEYDTSSDLDCMFENEHENTTFCADKPVSIDVEEKIVHPNFGSVGNNRVHDIALLKLSRPIIYTSFIKPICLPNNAAAYKRNIVSGWGKSFSAPGSKEKYMSYVNELSKRECAAKYVNVGIGVFDNQFCAGGTPSEKPCIGDAGGPLMGPERKPDESIRYTVFGVLSRVYSPSGTCNNNNFPGIYTNVIDYMPWILNQIRE